MAAPFAFLLSRCDYLAGRSGRRRANQSFSRSNHAQHDRGEEAERHDRGQHVQSHSQFHRASIDGITRQELWRARSMNVY